LREVCFPRRGRCDFSTGFTSVDSCAKSNEEYCLATLALFWTAIAATVAVAASAVHVADKLNDVLDWCAELDLLRFSVENTQRAMAGIVTRARCPGSSLLSKPRCQRWRVTRPCTQSASGYELSAGSIFCRNRSLPRSVQRRQRRLTTIQQS
jgi:hypothetical protein